MPNPWGVSWENDNTILIGEGPDGIWRVPDSGGTPEAVIKVAAGEKAHGPHLLPGGEWVLFTLLPSGTESWDEAHIVAQSLRTGERRVLIRGGHDGQLRENRAPGICVEQNVARGIIRPRGTACHW